jgi:hypothetical protein
MPLKTLGKPPYLLPTEIEQDDIVEIIEAPYIVPAEKTKWGKERGKAQIKILRNGLIRTWTMNNTTWDKLIQAFGEDPGFWLNKKVQVKKEIRNVSGVDKDVLFGKPYKEPQQQLKPEPFNPNLHGAKPLATESEYAQDFKTWLESMHLDYDKLTEEQKHALFTEYSNR